MKGIAKKTVKKIEDIELTPEEVKMIVDFDAELFGDRVAVYMLDVKPVSDIIIPELSPVGKHPDSHTSPQDLDHSKYVIDRSSAVVVAIGSGTRPDGSNREFLSKPGDLVILDMSRPHAGSIKVGEYLFVVVSENQIAARVRNLL